MPTPAEVSEDNDRTLRVIRHFDAPRIQVWRAFTEPAYLTRWLLGPPGWEMHVCEMDVRVGGRYRWRWRHASEGEFGFSGSYTAVEAGRLLRDRQVYDVGTHGVGESAETRNDVMFKDAVTGTQVTSRMEFPTAEGMAQAVATNMTDGMEMSYANLDRVLAGETA
ncbi:MAG: SRPBCC domain-containing protein [Pseudomonadota bacterium]